MSLFCDLELIMRLHAIVPLVDFVHALIKLAQSCDVFVCNFIDAMKVCQLAFYWLYYDPYIKFDDPILYELNALESLMTSKKYANELVHKFKW